MFSAWANWNRHLKIWHLGVIVLWSGVKLLGFFGSAIIIPDIAAFHNNAAGGVGLFEAGVGENSTADNVNIAAAGEVHPAVIGVAGSFIRRDDGIAVGKLGAGADAHHAFHLADQRIAIEKMSKRGGSLGGDIRNDVDVLVKMAFIVHTLGGHAVQIGHIVIQPKDVVCGSPRQGGIHGILPGTDHPRLGAGEVAIGDALIFQGGSPRPAPSQRSSISSAL